ncbi:MAG: NAD+ synthase [Candidatus Omnitrophica bacterium]|nr:NAD+ synthase [Candidatus Omnitrophota bacterium]
MKFSEKIVEWIKKQVKDTGKKGLVFGLSGGIDSAVLGALLKKALGDNVLGLILPCKSNPKDESLAKEAAQKFNIKTKIVKLDGVFNEISKTNPDSNNLAQANLKPRLRMTTMYYFANSMDYLVAGASNKSEITVGYFTKFGDGGADLLPLGNLLKKEVRALAVELEVPQEIISRPPSAGLWDNQTDETEMGITYDELDKVIVAIEKNELEQIDKALLSKVRGMMATSKHKRGEIPVFKK